MGVITLVGMTAKMDAEIPVPGANLGAIMGAIKIAILLVLQDVNLIVRVTAHRTVLVDVH